MRSLTTPVITALILLGAASVTAETALDIDLPSRPVNSDDDIFNSAGAAAPLPRRRNPITGKYENGDADSSQPASTGDDDLFNLGPAPTPLSTKERGMEKSEASNTESSIATPVMPLDRPLLNLDLPVKGMTMRAVEKKYGTPGYKNPAVGNPPIYRWDYQLFSVYFEQQYVIHAVIVDNVIEKGATNQ